MVTCHVDRPTEVDEVICAITPEPFDAVGRWYEDFSQTTDDEVRDLLALRERPADEHATPRSTTDSPDTDTMLSDAVRETAHSLSGTAHDYDPLLDRIGDARVVLLGEGTHGTHEFYRERARYACFDDFGEDPQVYGLITSSGVAKSCEDEVVSQLVELQRRATEDARRAGRVAADEFFSIEQNARLVKNAEAYYRTMFLEDVSSWNLRDRHMAETLDALVAHLDQQGGRSKVVVWAHNSHVRDARATQMGERGELNVGQLARERYDRDAVLVGFTTEHGTVTAASDWGGPAERKRVRSARAESYERVFHATQRTRFLLTWPASEAAMEGLRHPRLERAIGVIYRPDTERASHYFRARLAEQFDAVLHFDETRAVESLERTADWEAGEVAETF